MPPGAIITIPAPLRRNTSEPVLPMLRNVVRVGGQSPMFLSLESLSPTASAKAAERHRSPTESPIAHIDRFKEIVSPKVRRQNSGPKARSIPKRNSHSPSASPAERIKEILKPHLPRRNSGPTLGTQSLAPNDAWQHRVLSSPRMLRDKLGLKSPGGGKGNAVMVQEIVHDGRTRHVSFPDLSSKPVHRGEWDLLLTSIEQVFKFHPDEPVGSAPLPESNPPLKSCLVPPHVLIRRKVNQEKALPMSRGIVTVGCAEDPLSPIKTRFHGMYDDGGTMNSIFDF